MVAARTWVTGPRDTGLELPGEQRLSWHPEPGTLEPEGLCPVGLLLQHRLPKTV